MRFVRQITNDHESVVNIKKDTVRSLETGIDQTSLLNVVETAPLLKVKQLEEEIFPTLKIDGNNR